MAKIGPYIFFASAAPLVASRTTNALAILVSVAAAWNRNPDFEVAAALISGTLVTFGSVAGGLIASRFVRGTQDELGINGIFDIRRVAWNMRFANRIRDRRGALTLMRWGLAINAGALAGTWGANVIAKELIREVNPHSRPPITEPSRMGNFSSPVRVIDGKVLVDAGRLGAPKAG